MVEIGSSIYLVTYIGAHRQNRFCECSCINVRARNIENISCFVVQLILVD